MDPKVYKTAIEEYKADVEENPDAFKEMLQYKSE